MSIRTITQIMFLAAVSAAAQPSVAPGAVLNAASYTPSGLPGAGIAQGSMFVVFGTGLGPQTLERIQSLPLPGSLARTAVSVTVAGKTVGALSCCRRSARAPRLRLSDPRCQRTRDGS